MNSGRVVVTTGPSGGVGSTLVDAFLANSDRVVGTDLDSPALADLRERHGDARLLVEAADISKEADCLDLAQTVKTRLGAVDVLVNCAGASRSRASRT